MVEGFAKSLFVIMKLSLSVPHFTRICKRSKKLNIPKTPTGAKITDIVIDGSGIKVYGEGEWKVEQHGRDRRKKWKKIHVAIDPETQEVILNNVTEKNTHDSKMLPLFLEKIPRVGRVFGDGAYDTKACHKAIAKSGGRSMIPPRRTAKLWHTLETWAIGRNTAIADRERFVAENDRTTSWKKSRGYGVRSLVEAFFSRFKRSFGDRSYSKTDDGIALEVGLKCFLLNRFAHLGLPRSVLVQ